MNPVRPGDRGSAVEDIQRRLLVLGYDLGRTGIDGVYLGRTREAVEAFQREHGLAENGVVGDQTWAALVDATFTLGDRMLYLRVPHFHGRDVRSMQEALNALGFACGLTDGIFGTFTERAVREFQRNAGLAADGIVGADTVSALTNLRHVWEGKEPHAHSAAQARARAALRGSRAARRDLRSRRSRRRGDRRACGEPGTRHGGGLEASGVGRPGGESTRRSHRATGRRRHGPCCTWRAPGEDRRRATGPSAARRSCRRGPCRDAARRSSNSTVARYSKSVKSSRIAVAILDALCTALD